MTLQEPRSRSPEQPACPLCGHSPVKVTHREYGFPKVEAAAAALPDVDVQAIVLEAMRIGGGDFAARVQIAIERGRG